jgi:hypothetical protein
MVPGGYLLDIIGKKNNIMHFQNGMFTFVGISFFEMPCKILHSINVSPNILRKVLKVFTDKERFGPKYLPYFEGHNLKDVGLKARGDPLEQASLT